MKHYPYKVAYKAIFTVVGLVFAFFGTAAVLCVTYFVAAGFYSQKEWDYFKSGSLSRLNYLNASEIAHTYYPNLYRYRMLEEERKALTEGSGSADRVSAELDQLYPKIHQDQVRLSPENTNLRFSIIVGDSNIFESTYQGEDYGSFETYSFTINNEDLGQQETVQIDMYLMKPLTVADSYYQDSWSYQKLYDIRYLVIVQGVLSWVGMVAVMVYMICAAGHVEIEGRDTIVQNGFHLIPFDLLTLLLVGLANLMAYIRSHYSSSLMDFFHLVRGSQVFNYYALSISIMGMLDFGLIMFWSMSLAIRAKRHNLWEQMLLVRQLGWMKDQIKSIWQHLSIIRKGLIWTIVLTAVSITVGVFLSRPDLTWAIVLLCLADALTALILINRYQIARRRLGNQIHQMAEGNIEQHIDETTFSGELAREAQDLNRISDVVKTAVDERTRSDRLKTELITNVSHDIKTPLTNIINCSDLLRRSGTYDQTQTHYLDVLTEQSEKMKKLIEDLIEASKASTGNIKPQMGQIDLCEFLNQVSGEYTERLKVAGLELVLSCPDQPVQIMADGALLYRVMDNLLSNALKYSQKETRVYLSVSAGRDAAIMVRNVSNYQLNVSGEELVARFVRGDASRHTEGSGLGLSIALSLTQLMGGTMKIDVDGDLFKVVLNFPLAKAVPAAADT